MPNLFTTLTSFATLRHLELLLAHEMTIIPFEESISNGLVTHRFPYLRTLILDGFEVTQPALMKHFWQHHPGLETLALGPHIKGEWFVGFKPGMLPNLIALSVSIYVSDQLSLFMTSLVVHRRYLTMRVCFCLMSRRV